MLMTETQDTSTKRVLIVAGEASGDLHGGNLLKAAAEQAPQLSFYGVGGARMRAAGCEILFPSEDLAVMGLTEVLTHLPTIRDRFKRLEQLLRGTQKPDLLLLIDYPGFNLRLAKVAKEVGVPVLFYIGPKVWAWKKGRIRTIGQRVDRLALIFPFEPPLYAAEPVKAEYVGNPLLDEHAAAQPVADLRSEMQIDAGVPLVGLFPGSRSSEIRQMFQLLVATAGEILKQKPEAQFLVPVAPSLERSSLEALLDGCDLPIRLSEAPIYAVAEACDAVLCASGTATLQVALCGTPMAVLYRAAQLSYLVGKMVVKIPHFSLVNIVAQREIVREYLQHQASPSALCAEALRLLDDAAYRQKVEDGLLEVSHALGDPGCSVRVAQMALEMMESEGFDIKSGKEKSARG